MVGLDHCWEIGVASGSLVDQLAEKITVGHFILPFACRCTVQRGLVPVSHLARPERHGPALRCQFKLDNDNDATIEALGVRRADDEAAAIAAERIRSGAADHKEDGIEALKELGIQVPREEGRRGCRYPTR